MEINYREKGKGNGKGKGRGGKKRREGEGERRTERRKEKEKKENKEEKRERKMEKEVGKEKGRGQRGEGERNQSVNAVSFSYRILHSPCLCFLCSVRVIMGMSVSLPNPVYEVLHLQIEAIKLCL